MITISNLVYSSSDHRLIDMAVDGWLAQPIPFTYSASDGAPLTLEIAAIITSTYAIAPYVQRV